MSNQELEEAVDKVLFAKEQLQKAIASCAESDDCQPAWQHVKTMPGRIQIFP